MSGFVHRFCNGEHCGCKTAHTATWGMTLPTGDVPLIWRCENCGRTSPRKLRKPRVQAGTGMTASQAAAIEAIRERIIELRNRGFAQNYEFKHFEVRQRQGYVSLTVEIGRKGDEGTMASIYCRDRRIIAVGPRGGLELLNAKHKNASRGWFNAIHGLTG